MPKRKTIKITIVVAILLLVTICILRALILENRQREKFENKVYDTLTDFETVQEVANYLDCKYIKDIKSTNENYDYDIFLNFKVNLYTEGASNQDYYYTAAILFAQVTDYQNIRIIDESKDLLVAIRGDRTNKKITKLYKNGSENYYGEQDTIQALEDFKETKIARIEIQSTVLKDLITTNWQKGSINFGTQDSTFDGYQIYFDEGIELNVKETKVHNIVFTEKYKESIISDLTVNTPNEQIAEKLGKPVFGNAEYADTMIG